MDKETLSNYGWIVICVLVLAVMLALATPFGTFVADAIKSTTQGLFDVNQSALNSTGLINIGDQEFESCAHEYETVTTGDCVTGTTSTHTCKLCGKTYTETTPAGHVWDNTGLTCTKCNTKFGEYVFVASDYDAKMGTTTATDAVVVIPETFECYGSKFKVTGIGEKAFYQCSNLEKVVIPDSVTVISKNAFAGCGNLTDVNISSNLTTIGDGAFQGCVSLTSMVIPNSVNVLGSHTFYSCTSLKNITLSNNLTIIGTQTFEKCTSLENITIPANVTGIGDYAFDTCTALTSITFAEESKLQYIGTRAFSTWSQTACINLVNITFGGTIEQWNKVSLGQSWNYNVPATEVICSDGTVSLS